MTNNTMSWFSRIVFWFIALNAFAGGLSLLIFPTLSGSLFFWKIASPLSAGLLGALYLSGAVSVSTVALHGEWERARFLIPVLVSAGILISCVTLLHVDTFTRGVPLFYWLLVYTGTPILGIGIYLLHERRGANWAVVVPLRPATRRLALVSGAVILVAGLSILVWPAGLISWWPWSISALMLRIFAAWFSAFGVGLLWFQVDRDWQRLAHLVTLMIAVSTLMLMLVVRFRADVSTSGPRLWLYCAHLAAFGLLGVLMHWLQRPSRVVMTIFGLEAARGR